MPGHTIYRPENLNPFSKEKPLPVVAWGNGGCANSSQMHANFLVEIASQGFLVVAIGPFGVSGGASMQGGGTKSAQLLEALDWATTENARRDSKYFGKVNPAKFAAAGMSCGGLQALEVSPDRRVTTSIIMNSGVLNTPMPQLSPPKTAPPTGSAPAGPPPKMMMAMPAVGKDTLKRLHAPIFYVIGGEKDIAYPNAVDDFSKIESVPVAMANLDVGHGGTYSQPNGGEFGKVHIGGKRRAVVWSVAEAVQARRPDLVLVVLAVEERLVLKLRAGCADRRVAFSRLRVVFQKGHPFGGRQGGQIHRAQPRGAAAEGPVERVPLGAGQHAVFVLVPSDDHVLHGPLDVAPVAIEPLAVAAHQVLAIGIEHCAALTVEGRERLGLPMGDAAVGRLEAEFLPAQSPGERGEKPGVGLGVVPHVVAVAQAATVRRAASNNDSAPLPARCALFGEFPGLHIVSFSADSNLAYDQHNR